MSSFRSGQRSSAGPLRGITVVAIVSLFAACLTSSAAEGDEAGPPLAAVGGPDEHAAPPAGTPVPLERTAAPAAADVMAVRRAPVGPAQAYAGAVEAIPDPALAAYQRAASVINATVECRLDWEVLAAIGRVQSNHGRGLDGTHRLGRAGVSRPALVAAPLDGKRGRGRVSDTDGGALDGNGRWDAPVGPMGHLPAAWAAVAVDADGNGLRTPQDVDDASLAAAVLLCSGERDLARRAQLRAALAAYDGARGFVDTVLAVARRYREAWLATAVVPLGGAPVPADLPGDCPCPALARASTSAADARDGAEQVTAMSDTGRRSGKVRKQPPLVATAPPAAVPPPAPPEVPQKPDRPDPTDPTDPTPGPVVCPPPAEVPEEGETPAETPDADPADPVDPADPADPVDPVEECEDEPDETPTEEPPSQAPPTDEPTASEGPAATPPE